MEENTFDLMVTSKTEIGYQGGTGHYRIPAINGEPKELELDHYEYKSAWAPYKHN